MLISCSLCGGKNDVQPGQKMLSCAFCGSSLAIDEGAGPEHLILPHERNDRYAEEALSSYLLRKSRPHPRDMKTEFSFVPFMMIEDEKGQLNTIPAGGSPPFARVLPFPPSGGYRFFNAQLAKEEKVHPLGEIGEDTSRVLHLPVYRIAYTAGGGEWEALVIGESWMVSADDIPPERPFSFNIGNTLAAAALFTAFLFLGKLAPGWLERLFYIAAASTAGFAAYVIRRKAASRT